MHKWFSEPYGKVETGKEQNRETLTKLRNRKAKENWKILWNSLFFYIVFFCWRNIKLKRNVKMLGNKVAQVPKAHFLTKFIILSFLLCIQHLLDCLLWFTFCISLPQQLDADMQVCYVLLLPSWWVVPQKKCIICIHIIFLFAGNNLYIMTLRTEYGAVWRLLRLKWFSFLEVCYSPAVLCKKNANNTLWSWSCRVSAVIKCCVFSRNFYLNFEKWILWIFRFPKKCHW